MQSSDAAPPAPPAGGDEKSPAVAPGHELTAAALGEIREAFDFPQPMMAEDDGALVNVGVPPEYCAVPPFGFALAHHHAVTALGVAEYFGELLENRISFINGRGSDPDMRYAHCDYCRTELLPEVVGRAPASYWYCRACKKDMCLQCFSEKTEEIAVAGGAKNYELRREALQLCFGDHHLQSRPAAVGARCGVSCDVCFDVAWNPRNSDRQKNMDVCDDCAATDKGAAYVDEHKLVAQGSKVAPFDWHLFGSLLDWVPVVGDDEGGLVLVNCNAAAPLCGKVAFRSMDDHGRTGYDYCDDSLADVLQQLTDLVKEDNSGAVAPAEGSGWEDFYGMPIKRVMGAYNMQIHFG